MPRPAPSPPPETRPKDSSSTSFGRRSCSTPAGPWCRGRRNTAVARRACSNGSSSKRSITAPAVRSASRRTASSCSPPRCSLNSGSQAQKDRILPRMAEGLDLWCQGWSEPNAGSDLASISQQGRARRGQRRLATQRPRRPGPPAAQPTATGCFGLFRTDPAADRHKGMTYFLVPLDAPRRSRALGSAPRWRPGFRRKYFWRMCSSRTIASSVA